MNWKRSIKIAGLWFTLSNVPVKKRNSRKVGDRDNIDSSYRMKDIRRDVKAKQGYRCPMCGEVSERMELHHILPVARFPELWDDRRNCVAFVPRLPQGNPLQPVGEHTDDGGESRRVGVGFGSKIRHEAKIVQIFSVCKSTSYAI